MYHEITPMGFGIAIEAGKTLYSEQSAFQKVEIFESRAFGNVLTLDGLMMTTEKDEFFYHEMISHVALCAHSNPENVLVIGGGDGGTVREVLKYETVKSVVMCEIDGLVIEASKEFLPEIACGLDDKRVEILTEDAIEFIKNKKACYDVVLIDSTDPMGPGEGLFTEEFYTDVKNSLKAGGIMCAQSESPFANQNEMKKMYPILRKVFKYVSPYCGPVPTYPAGYWSWAFCSNALEGGKVVNADVADKISSQCKLYNKELHEGVFKVPNFVKELTC
jgi:spermidine synthase